MAEMNLEKMESSSGEQQHYRLLAIQTMRNAKILQEQQEYQPIARGSTTGENGRYISTYGISTRSEMLPVFHP